MKKLVLNTFASLVVLLLFGSTAFAQPDAPSTEGPMIRFEEETHDFGDLMQGGDASVVFKFSNPGTAELVISDVKKACGCTTPTWDGKTILPGGESEIDVRYDSNRIGGFNKTVTITSNAVNDPVKIIVIKGNIIAKPEEPQPNYKLPLAPPEVTH
jgi:hypothetical protein